MWSYRRSASSSSSSPGASERRSGPTSLGPAPAVTTRWTAGSGLAAGVLAGSGLCGRWARRGRDDCEPVRRWRGGERLLRRCRVRREPGPAVPRGRRVRASHVEAGQARGLRGKRRRHSGRAGNAPDRHDRCSGRAGSDARVGERCVDVESRPPGERRPRECGGTRLCGRGRFVRLPVRGQWCAGLAGAGSLTVRESTAGAADDRASVVVSRAGGVVDLRDAAVPEDGGRLDDARSGAVSRCTMGLAGAGVSTFTSLHVAGRRHVRRSRAWRHLDGACSDDRWRRGRGRHGRNGGPLQGRCGRLPHGQEGTPARCDVRRCSVRGLARLDGAFCRKLRCGSLRRREVAWDRGFRRVRKSAGAGRLVPFGRQRCVASTAARSSVRLPDPTPRVRSVTLGAVTTGVVCDVRCTSVARAARTEVARTGTDGAVGLAGATCDASRVDSTRRSTAGDVDDEAAGTPGASAPRCGGSRPATNGAASTATVGSTSSSLGDELVSNVSRDRDVRQRFARGNDVACSGGRRRRSRTVAAYVAAANV